MIFKYIMVFALVILTLDATCQSINDSIKTNTPIPHIFEPASIKSDSSKWPLRVSIVCVGTIDDATPLIILDGKIVDAEKLKRIKTNNISSINILRDSTRIALYGSSVQEAIVIQTKRFKRRQ